LNWIFRIVPLDRSRGWHRIPKLNTGADSLGKTLPYQKTAVSQIENKFTKYLVLSSDNARCAPIYLSPADMASVRIIGKVIWIRRELD
jgi:hypothetical protein